jgi:carbon storage regulator CsrA
MLILTKKVGEEIAFGKNIYITVVAIKGDEVRLGITAPKELVVTPQGVHESNKHHFRKNGESKMGFVKTLLGGTAIDYLQEGKTYLERDLYWDAIEAFEESIRLNPKIADTYFYRGDAYFAEDDFGQAITDYDKAIAINPNLASAYHKRGLAYLEAGDVARGKADQQRAIQLDPSLGRK